MSHATVPFDRRAADCGGSTFSQRRAGAGGFFQMLRPFMPRSRSRLRPPEPLSDHLMRDIGLSRADLQAMFL